MLVSQTSFLLILLLLVGCNPEQTAVSEEFQPGIEISRANSYITTSSSEVFMGETATVTLHLKDQKGSPYISNLPSISFFIKGGVSAGTFSPFINNQDGSYTTTFTAATPGSPAILNAMVDNIALTGNLPSIEVIPIVQLDWLPLTHNFGTVALGETSTAQSFTLTNSDVGVATDCSPPSLTNSSDFTIVTDNCGTSDLGGSSSCSVTLVANPGTEGIKTTTLSRSCVVGDQASTSSEAIKVTGVPLPTLAWDPLNEAFYPTAVGELTESRTFTLTNDGPGVAIDCSAPTLSNTTDFKISIDNCGVNDLAAASSCSVNIQGTPQSTGSKYTTLSRSCRIGGVVSTTVDGISLSASNPVPSLSWSNPSFNFGEVKLGTSSPVLNLSLLNKGFGDATGCSTPVLSNTTDFTLVEDGCAAADLAKNGKCTLLVKATPATAGAKTATLTRSCAVGGTISTSLTTAGHSASPIELTSGSNHNCALMSDGTVKCWGNNGSRQLGDGNYLNTPLPVGVMDLTGVSAISSNHDHNCAVINDGSVKCWGVNNYGQLGDGTKLARTTPVTVSALTGATAVAVGSSFSCALLSDSQVKCWGGNSYGQLGNGSTTESLTPVTVTGLSGVIAISAGSTHACALLTDGTGQCWGLNNANQLGDGTGVSKSSPVVISNLIDANKIFLGANSSCAVKIDKTVHCWGSGFAKTPYPISGLSNVDKISLNIQHRCAALMDGSIQCWGYNSYGQNGDGSNSYKSSPTTVSGISGAVDVSTGNYHSCSLLDDGSVRCWGRNDYGQLGDSQFNFNTEPVRLGISNVLKTVNGSQFSCALKSDNTVNCWGQNNYGQLGDGSRNFRATPAPVTGLSSVSEISAGNNHVCALLFDGTIQCWGQNGSGQIGDGSGLTSIISPAPVQGISTATAITTGELHSCALLADKTIKCWGAGSFGQLGDGTGISSRTPVEVTSINNARGISAGNRHTCAHLEDGRAKCWGSNAGGLLGDGTTIKRNSPVDVQGLTNVTSMAAGNSHTCALLEDKTGRCWGGNGTGQLGNGGTSQQLTPKPIMRLTNAISMTSSSNHNCALLTDGSLKCWANNSQGQLGTGDKSVAFTPISVYGLASAAAVSTAQGANSTCSTLTNGDVYCWGDNSYSQLMFNEFQIRRVSGF